MLGSKNVLDMLKSEKIDDENHTENNTEKTTQKMKKNETCECMEREARFHLRELLSKGKHLSEVLVDLCETGANLHPFQSLSSCIVLQLLYIVIPTKCMCIVLARQVAFGRACGAPLAT